MPIIVFSGNWSSSLASQELFNVIVFIYPHHAIKRAVLIDCHIRTTVQILMRQKKYVRVVSNNVVSSGELKEIHSRTGIVVTHNHTLLLHSFVFMSGKQPRMKLAAARKVRIRSL